MLDEKDLQILQLLQRNARMTASEVAGEVGLSVPAAAERIKKLVEHGIITAFTARLNAKQLGFDLTAFIAVVSASSDHYEEIIDQARDNPAVLECHSITGEGSHLLKVRVRNSTELEKLLRDIQAWPGVIRTHTMVVLSTYKESSELELNLDDSPRSH
jgi:Lrp/AsnC family leucine-responsive transcriptional regulator